MTIKSFDPKEVTVIAGASPVLGLAEDAAISIEAEEAQYNINSDIHGNITRYRVNKNIAKVTLTLTQASDSNSLFSAFATLDREKNAGKFPLFIKDNSGKVTLFTCAEAYVEKVANIDYGNENKNREWTIICPNPISVIGGIN